MERDQRRGSCIREAGQEGLSEEVIYEQRSELSEGMSFVIIVKGGAGAKALGRE